MTDTRRNTSILAGCGLVLVAVLGAVPAAVAANDIPSEQPPLVLAQAATFDDEKLEAFASAVVEVEEIRANYAAPFQEAESDAQRAEINQQAAQEMTQAIEEAPNITLDEYNAVIQAAQQDPDLATRINQLIADEQL